MNYAELRENILDYTGNTDPEFSVKINSFIRQAEAKIATLAKLPAYSKVTTLSILANTATLAAPSDFLSVDYITIPTYGILEKKDPSFILEAWPDPAERGQPRVYGLQDAKTFVFGPTPDIGYSAPMKYFAKWPSIVDLGINSGTQNQETFISQFFETALLHGSLYFAQIYQEDAEMAQVEHAELLESLGLVTKFQQGRDRRPEAEAQSASIDADKIY